MSENRTDANDVLGPLYTPAQRPGSQTSEPASRTQTRRKPRTGGSNPVLDPLYTPAQQPSGRTQEPASQNQTRRKPRTGGSNPVLDPLYTPAQQPSGRTQEPASQNQTRRKPRTSGSSNPVLAPLYTPAQQSSDWMKEPTSGGQARTRNPALGNSTPRNTPVRPNGYIADSEVRGMNLEQRLIKAMELAVNSGKLSKEMQQSLRQLLTPDNLKILAGIISLWGVGHLFGYGQAADAVLAGLGVLGLGFESAKAAQALWGFFSEAQNAQSFAGLQKSSDHFAEFVSAVGTNALFAFIGRNAGKAVEGLSGVVTKAGRKLNEMTPAVRKFAKEALEASQNLLANAGTSINNSLGKLRNVWDNLWNGGGRQLQPAGSGKIPPNNKKPNESRGSSSASNQSGTSEQAYNNLRTRVHLTAETANRLRAKGIDVKVIENLNKHGLTPEKLNAFLDNILQNSSHKYGLESMPKIANTMSALASKFNTSNKGMSMENIQKLTKIAAAQPEVFHELSRIANSSGELTNPNALIKLADNAVENFKKSKLDEFGNPTNDRGFLREMRIAADRLERGNTIQLGAVPADPKNPKVKSGGDIVDFTDKETIQVKHVVSRDGEAVLKRADEASQQLLGKSVEQPIPGFRQVAEIRIEKGNGFFNKGGDFINREIQKKISAHGEFKNFDGFIRIVKEDGTGKVLEVLRFRIKDGVSQFIPKPPVIDRRSSLENNTLTASNLQQDRQPEFIQLLARQRNPGLYTAMDTTQQLDEQWQRYRQDTASITPDLTTYKSQQLLNKDAFIALDGGNLITQTTLEKNNPKIVEKVSRGIELG